MAWTLLDEVEMLIEILIHPRTTTAERVAAQRQLHKLRMDTLRISGGLGQVQEIRETGQKGDRTMSKISAIIASEQLRKSQHREQSDYLVRSGYSDPLFKPDSGVVSTPVDREKGALEQSGNPVGDAPTEEPFYDEGDDPDEDPGEDPGADASTDDDEYFEDDTDGGTQEDSDGFDILKDLDEDNGDDGEDEDESNGSGAYGSGGTGDNGTDGPDGYDDDCWRF